MLSTAPAPLTVAVETMPASRPISRQIACMAGFFADPVQARAACLALAGLPGIDARCCLQLGPTDARPWRFQPLSRRWAAPWQADLKPPRSALWRRSGQALLLAAALALLWWMQFDPAAIDAARLPLVWTALASAAALGTGLVMFGGGWRAPRRPRRFDREVHQALTAGQWAVVVHGLDWAGQQQAVATLRQGALGWCAEPAPGGRL